MLSIIGLVFFVVVLIFYLTYAFAGLSAAPYLPTRKNDLERFIALAQIKPGEKVVDLGSGDGRLLFAAAEKGAVAVGYEISLFPYFLSRFRLWRKIRQGKIKKNQIEIKCRDFWGADLLDADVIYLFLMPRPNKKFAAMAKNLKKGTRLLAYVWPIPGYKPLKIDDTPNRAKIYLYQVS